MEMQRRLGLGDGSVNIFLFKHKNQSSNIFYPHICNHSIVGEHVGGSWELTDQSAYLIWWVSSSVREFVSVQWSTKGYKIPNMLFWSLPEYSWACTPIYSHTWPCTIHTNKTQQNKTHIYKEIKNKIEKKQWADSLYE